MRVQNFFYALYFFVFTQVLFVLAYKVVSKQRVSLVSPATLFVSFAPEKKRSIFLHSNAGGNRGCGGGMEGEKFVQINDSSPHTVSSPLDIFVSSRKSSSSFFLSLPLFPSCFSVKKEATKKAKVTRAGAKSFRFAFCFLPRPPFHSFLTAKCSFCNSALSSSSVALLRKKNLITNFSSHRSTQDDNPEDAPTPPPSYSSSSTPSPPSSVSSLGSIISELEKSSNERNIASDAAKLLSSLDNQDGTATHSDLLDQKNEILKAIGEGKSSSKWFEQAVSLAETNRMMEGGTDAASPVSRPPYIIPFEEYMIQDTVPYVYPPALPPPPAPRRPSVSSIKSLPEKAASSSSPPLSFYNTPTDPLLDEPLILKKDAEMHQIEKIFDLIYEEKEGYRGAYTFLNEFESETVDGQDGLLPGELPHEKKDDMQTINAKVLEEIYNCNSSELDNKKSDDLLIYKLQKRVLNVELFVTELHKHSSILPGEKLVINLAEVPDKKKLIYSFEGVKSNVIFIGWTYTQEQIDELDRLTSHKRGTPYIEKSEEAEKAERLAICKEDGAAAKEGQKKGKIAEEIEKKKKKRLKPVEEEYDDGTKAVGVTCDFDLLNYGAIAYPTDTSMLEKTGNVVFTIIGRFKIMDIRKADNRVVKAKVYPMTDKDESFYDFARKDSLDKTLNRIKEKKKLRKEQANQVDSINYNEEDKEEAAIINNISEEELNSINEPKDLFKKDMLSAELVNPHENINDVLNDVSRLYDRCNRLEYIYNRQQNYNLMAAKVKERRNFDNITDEINLKCRYLDEERINELISFSVLEGHVDYLTKIVAIRQTYTLERLCFARNALKEKIKTLKESIDMSAAYNK